VDVALTTTFGPSKLEKFLVWTDDVTEETPRNQPVSQDVGVAH
jgi:hypothetical protein